uniref:Uncharacterized protein n=1 Tax=Kalanchoe fedtschenkoi TaxID=63787 RepID=A0A7N0TNT8_KALFE
MDGLSSRQRRRWGEGMEEQNDLLLQHRLHLFFCSTFSSLSPYTTPPTSTPRASAATVHSFSFASAIRICCPLCLRSNFFPIEFEPVSNPAVSMLKLGYLWMLD